MANRCAYTRKKNHQEKPSVTVPWLWPSAFWKCEEDFCPLAGPACGVLWPHGKRGAPLWKHPLVLARARQKHLSGSTRYFILCHRLSHHQLPHSQTLTFQQHLRRLCVQLCSLNPRWASPMIGEQALCHWAISPACLGCFTFRKHVSATFLTPTSLWGQLCVPSLATGKWLLPLPAESSSLHNFSSENLDISYGIGRSEYIP